MEGAPRIRLFRRWLRFNAVGATGIAVQLALLAALTGAGVPTLAATAMAVEASVLHNFHLHVRWTWKDRELAGTGLFHALARFHAFNGALSLGGNISLMAALNGGLGIPPVPANLLSIAIIGVVNFLIADRIAFARASARRQAREPDGRS